MEVHRIHTTNARELVLVELLFTYTDFHDVPDL